MSKIIATLYAVMDKRLSLIHISFGLLAGVVSVGMIITQGATYLQMRTVGELHLRTRATAQVAALVTLSLIHT